MLSDLAPGETQKFSKRDADVILEILDNQQVQNLKVARELMALQRRFSVFVAQSLAAAQEKDKQDARPKQSAKANGGQEKSAT